MEKCNSTTTPGFKKPPIKGTPLNRDGSQATSFYTGSVLLRRRVDSSFQQQARNERARKNFLDRSLRDARPTPPTAQSAPPKAAEDTQVVSAVVAETAGSTTGSLPDAVTAQTSLLCQHRYRPDEQEPASSYLQQALSVLKAPFRTNKKRAHSGCSKDVEQFESSNGLVHHRVCHKALQHPLLGAPAINVVAEEAPTGAQLVQEAATGAQFTQAEVDVMIWQSLGCLGTAITGTQGLLQTTVANHLALNTRVNSLESVAQSSTDTIVNTGAATVSDL
eukprot:2379246-Amphidinium_carterae.2